MSQWKSTIMNSSAGTSPIQTQTSSNLLTAIADSMLASIHNQVKKEVMESIEPVLKEQASWKNTMIKKPVDGKDGATGPVGPKGLKGDKGEKGDKGDAGVPGKDGKDGFNGASGSTWHYTEASPDDIGVDGDFCFNKENFEIYIKQSSEWKSLGTIKAKDKTGYIGGANGDSAYQIAVKNGFVGSEQEWLASLAGSSGDVVSQTITNGVTDKAPSENAVFSALQLKANLTTPVFVTNITTPRVIGSSAPGGSLTLESSSNATKGQILFGASGYDQVNNRLGVGTASPASKLAVNNAIATDIGLTLNGFTSQSGDYLRVNDSVSNVLMRFSSAGQLQVGRDGDVGARLIVTGGAVGSAMITLVRPSSAQVSWSLAGGGLAFSDDLIGSVICNMFGNSGLNEVVIGQKNRAASDTRDSHLSAQSYGPAAGTDVVGRTFVINGGTGTGAATSPSIVFRTADAVASGTTQQNATTKMTLTGLGRLGVGVAAPTARLHLQAGTAAANTAPLKFNTGALLGAAEAGSIEFLTDDFYATITTGAARKKIVLSENSGAARMPTTGAALVAGNAVLVAGTATVNTTAATANALILLTRRTAGGTIGTSMTYTISAGTSFTITSNNVLDTSTVTYLIIEGY